MIGSFSEGYIALHTIQNKFIAIATLLRFHSYDKFSNLYLIDSYELKCVKIDILAKEKSISHKKWSLNIDKLACCAGSVSVSEWNSIKIYN